MRNNIFDNPHDGINTISRIQDMTHNLFTRESFGDSSNFVGDPAFVNPEKGNFRLKPESAAIDRGQPTDLDTDADGNPRMRDEAADAGAYEYFGAAGLDWIPVYRHWESGWKFTPYGLVFDYGFPWCYRSAWPGETEAGEPEGFWFYVVGLTDDPDGFFAYDNHKGHWFWGSPDAAPFIYSYTGSSSWIQWGM